MISSSFRAQAFKSDFLPVVPLELFNLELFWVFQRWFNSWLLFFGIQSLTRNTCLSLGKALINQITYSLSLLILLNRHIVPLRRFHIITSRPWLGRLKKEITSFLLSLRAKTLFNLNGWHFKLIFLTFKFVIVKKTKEYGKRGLNPRPLACEASVITTRPHPLSALAYLYPYLKCKQMLSVACNLIACVSWS